MHTTAQQVVNDLWYSLIVRETNAAVLTGLIDSTRETNAAVLTGLIDSTRETNAAVLTGLIDSTRETNAAVLTGLIDSTRETNAAVLTGLIDSERDRSGGKQDIWPQRYCEHLYSCLIQIVSDCLNCQCCHCSGRVECDRGRKDSVVFVAGWIYGDCDFSIQHSHCC